jgi:Rad3-related DNA helicase
MYKRLTSEILKHKRGSKTTLTFTGKEEHLSKCKSYIEYMKRLEVLLQIFRANPSSYIKMYNVENNGSEDIVKAILKPLEPKHIAKILFDRSKYVLLMSATICGVKEFAANLGIKEYGFDCLSSPFPIENRLIMLHNLEGLNNGNFSKLVDLYIEKLDEILDCHDDDRGIIHTVSYSNQKLIESKSRHAKRFILPKRGEVFDVGKLKSTKNGVLLSPSMTEGVDLADDLSRFQVIFKIPFANLGDNWIKKKMELSYVWYLIQVARTFSQACGRSVRHKDDTAITHVIDGNINKITHLLPKYIQEALKEDN